MGKPAHIRVFLAKGKLSNSQSGSLAGSIFFREFEVDYELDYFRAVFNTSNSNFSASVELYASESGDTDDWTLVEALSTSLDTPQMQSASFGNPFDSEPFYECRISSEDPSAVCVLGSAEILLSGTL